MMLSRIRCAVELWYLHQGAIIPQQLHREREMPIFGCWQHIPMRADVTIWQYLIRKGQC